MIILVLGGTRSGKSAHAEHLAAGLPGPVTYLATARVDPRDADHVARIARHRQRRPAHWETIECPEPADLAGLLRATSGTVLVDSVGTWVAGHDDLLADPAALVDALLARTGDTVLVSEEVGLAPHAPTELGRRFADALGDVNRAVSAVADSAVLVVAGRPLDLPPPPC